MHIINATNVRDALPQAVEYLLSVNEIEETRLGDAFVSPVPVCIRYSNPKQHVLLNPIRDANPFFHLMEAMWMLDGRSDGAFFDPYIKNFSRDYGDEEGVIPDAYGYRWRFGYGEDQVDQLEEIIRHLKRNPTSRQAVLLMWGLGRKDLWEEKWKPCNLVASFRIVDNRLNMLVANRSNDLIWGACGANAVHFALLQEYLALMIGVELGEYWQVSNNLHLYLDHLNMLNNRAEGDFDYRCLETLGSYGPTLPLVNNPETFDVELICAMEYIDQLHCDVVKTAPKFKNMFLSEVVISMALVHYYHKKGKHSMALHMIEHIAAQDWQIAAHEWLERHDGQSK